MPDRNVLSLTGKLEWSRCRLGLKLVIPLCALGSLLDIIGEMMYKCDCDVSVLVAIKIPSLKTAVGLYAS